MTELIYCAAGNPRYAAIAIRYGFTYGAQLPSKFYFPVEFADQDWKQPNRAKYMKALAETKPRLATVLDLEHEAQFDEVLSWAEEAAQHVTEAVLIIPKVSGVIDRLPKQLGGIDVRLAYSVPTRYGGTHVPTWEFGRWPVHLLGGSPQAQYDLARYLNVVSVDGNYAQKIANQFTNYFDAGGRSWRVIREVYGEMVQDALYFAFELSCMNIQALWAGAKAHYRFAMEADIQPIRKIAQQYRQELGYVMPPALRESITRKTLIICENKAGQVVGFVNYRARKDGGQTIYEIAVDKQARGQRLGAGLLACVPRPIRLKCTTDNPANAFYAKQGGELVGVDPGKKRPLNVWTFPVSTL